MEKELQKIGHRIKLLRIENKISQKVLAKKLCISQTHLSNIENGRVVHGNQGLRWTVSWLQDRIQTALYLLWHLTQNN